MVQLRAGPNEKLLKQLRSTKFGIFKWKNIRRIVKIKTTESEYDNLFWGSYLGYAPIERNLYLDSADNYFFKFENEWKLAIKSSDLGHLAKVNNIDHPTVFDHYGELYCYFSDIEAANR